MRPWLLGLCLTGRAGRVQSATAPFFGDHESSTDCLTTWMWLYAGTDLGCGRCRGGRFPARQRQIDHNGETASTKPRLASANRGFSCTSILTVDNAAVDTVNVARKYRGPRCPRRVTECARAASCSTPWTSSRADLIAAAGAYSACDPGSPEPRPPAPRSPRIGRLGAYQDRQLQVIYLVDCARVQLFAGALGRRL